MVEDIPITILHELIRDIAGKPAEPIADILKDKDEVNEYKIADKLKLTVNQVRNILYKLFDKSVVSFTRKKDKQKGWYIYFWSLNTFKALEQFVKIKRAEIEELKRLISNLETKHYYSCPGGCVELSEETALQYNFICQECGQLLVLSQKKERIQDMNKAIDKAEKQVNTAQKELAAIEVVNLKKEEKVNRKKLKKKAKERKAKQKIRNREKRKLERKKTKKKVKKKFKKKAKKKKKRR